jgi:hypothetical protein
MLVEVLRENRCSRNYGICLLEVVPLRQYQQLILYVWDVALMFDDARYKLVIGIQRESLLTFICPYHKTTQDLRIF